MDKNERQNQLNEQPGRHARDQARDQAGDQLNGESIGANERRADGRGVSVSRTGFERYTVTTKAGAQLEFGRGEGLVDPVDMLLAGLAGCMAISMEKPLVRAAEPDRFDVTVTADKLQDEAFAPRLDNIRLDVDVALTTWSRKQDPQDFVNKLLQIAHDTHCTVSRTLEAGAHVATEAHVEVGADSEVTGTSAGEDA